MLSKQLNTFQQKTQKGAAVIDIYEERCGHKQDLLTLLEHGIAAEANFTDEQKGDIELRKTMLRMKIERLDVLQSLTENKVALKIKKEIQAEDKRALDRIKAEYDQLSKEVDEGLMESKIEDLKAFVRNVKNKQADLSPITALFTKAAQELNADEKIDLYKQVKSVWEGLPKK